MNTPSPIHLRAARIITEASAPAVSLAVVMALVGWQTTHGTVAGLLWGLLAAAVAASGPMFCILRGVRRGSVTDRHVGHRQQRRVPLLAGLGSVCASCTLLTAAGAPRPLRALLVAGFMGLAVSLLITHWWKMSLHTAVAGGAIAILVLVFGPVLLAAIAVLVLIGWSRVAIGDHTVAQVAAGSAIGGLTAATTFALLQ